MAAENIDNTVGGTGLFNAKIPGLSDAADIQAALRLYHYGSYAYDGANTDVSNLLPNSIAKYLQNLIDADAAEVVNRNTAISTHNSDTTDVHGIPNTANLATQAFVTTSITNAVNGATGGYPNLAGEAIDWNSVDLRFDVVPQLANVGTVVTKTESFALSPEDVGKTAVLYSSNPMTVTLPANDSVEIPVGYSIDIIQTGTGSVTVSEESGSVAINSKSNIKSLDGQYSKGTLVKIDTNTWFFFGNLLNAVTPVTPVAPTPVAPTPVAPTPVAPTPVEPAPTPTPPTPTPPTPTPPTPTPPAPTPTPPAPTPTPPQLPTPSLSVTSSGYNIYPNTVYANIGVGNYDYQNTYTATMGNQNIEFPEEWNIENMSPNTSYTVYVTASRAGYTSATGSITFTSHYVAPTPTPPAPTPTPPTPTPPTSCTMPPVVGDTESIGSGKIVSAGIAYEYRESYGNAQGATAQNNGTIAAQDPAAYTTHPCNFQTNATIYVYDYVATTPTPPTPTPPTPTPPTPVAKTETSRTTGTCIADVYCPEGGERLDTIYYSDGTNDQQYVCCSYTPTPTPPTPVAPTPVNVCAGDMSMLNPSQCTACGYYYSTQYGECLPSNPNTPAPVAPAPVAPTPVALSCSPGNGNCGSSPCSDCDPARSGVQADDGCASGYRNVCWTGGSCPNTGDCVPVTPVAPAPTAPAPTAPAPTAPAPTGCVYTGSLPPVPCGYNMCVYSNCGDFLGYTST